MDPSFGENESEHSFSILTRAHSIAVEQFHGMEQVGVRLPVGPPLRSVQRSFEAQALKNICYED